MAHLLTNTMSGESAVKMDTEEAKVDTDTKAQQAQPQGQGKGKGHGKGKQVTSSG